MFILKNNVNELTTVLQKPGLNILLFRTATSLVKKNHRETIFGTWTLFLDYNFRNKAVNSLFLKTIAYV